MFKEQAYNHVKERLALVFNEFLGLFLMKGHSLHSVPTYSLSPSKLTGKKHNYRNKVPL